jgi:septal ring factor EnvC (AmiA/AmiB activator)
MLQQALAAAAPAATSSLWVTIAIAVIGSSALAAGFTGWLNRKKISREAESIQVESMDKVMERLNKEITRQDTLIETLRRESERRAETDETRIRALTREIESLTRRLDTAESKASHSDERANMAEDQARRLRLEVVGLQYAVQQYAARTAGLQNELRSHGITVPDWANPEIPDVDAELRNVESRQQR